MPPFKIPPHDEKLRKRVNKIETIAPAHLARSKKYRSSSNWQKVRAIHLKEYPLCFDPHGDHAKDNRSVPAKQVHHILGLETHFHLRAYPKNLASLCTGCHSKIENLERSGKKTAYLFR
jgi:hypothetical protein